jgi:hypothetical protein
MSTEHAIEIVRDGVVMGVQEKAKSGVVGLDFCNDLALVL